MAWYGDATMTNLKKNERTVLEKRHLTHPELLWSDLDRDRVKKIETNFFLSYRGHNNDVGHK